MKNESKISESIREQRKKIAWRGRFTKNINHQQLIKYKIEEKVRERETVEDLDKKKK